MRLRHLPIRWRLTFWYAAFLALVLTLFGVGLYFGLRWRLFETFDGQLFSQAEVTLGTVQLQDGAASLPSTTLGGEQAGEYFLRLLRTDGDTVVDTGDAIGNVPLDRSLVAAAHNGATSFSTAKVEGETLRIVTIPMYDHRPGDAGSTGESEVAGDEREARNANLGLIVGVLQFGLFRDDIEDALSELLGVLALSLPVALLVAAGGGYLLAGRALAPVAAITSVAASIRGSDLHARLNLALPNDELGRLARTFDDMLARIEDAFERQRRFTGDAAHELRTPLSLMRSQVDLALARPRDTRAYQDALRELDEDLERLTSLVSALLALARADGGTLFAERASFDLAEIIRAIVEQYEHVAATAGIELVDASSPTLVLADQDQIVQVLVNLMDNALAHTPAGGRITLGTGSREGSVWLSVADTGSGIALEHQDRIFERFYRVDTGRTRALGGAGLGLSICQAIVAANGGTINLSSFPEEATVVAVILRTP